MDFGVFWLLFVAFAALGIIHFVGQLWALVDTLRREDAEVVGDSRLIWVLITIFVPFGWLLYFVVGRR